MNSSSFVNRLKRHGIFALGYFLLTCASVAATLDWNFVSSNGGISIEGQFSTDGTLAETQGTGTQVFNITEWKSLTLNGGDSGIPAERFPSTPVSGIFTWDRDAQSILNPSSVVLSGRYLNTSGIQESFFQLAFSPGQTRLQDLVDFNPNLAFTPIPANSSLTPVPEPSFCALASGALVLGWACWRRREHGLSVSQVH